MATPRGCLRRGVATNAVGITAETARAAFAESANAMDIAAETARAQAAEQANTDAIASEMSRAQGAEQTNATAITNETDANTALISILEARIDALEIAPPGPNRLYRTIAEFSNCAPGGGCAKRIDCGENDQVVSGSYITVPEDGRWTINEYTAVRSPIADLTDPLDAWFVNARIDSSTGGACLGGSTAGVSCPTFNAACPGGGICGIRLTVQSLCLDLTP